MLTIRDCDRELARFSSAKAAAERGEGTANPDVCADMIDRWLDCRLGLTSATPVAAFPAAVDPGDTCDCESCRATDRSGDALYHETVDELHEHHVKKTTAAYGTPDDRLANFTIVAAARRQHAEIFALERILDKTVRALNMIAADRHDDVDEYHDIASLALNCEVMRRRRRIQGS